MVKQTGSLRGCEEIGWQAKAPAPLKRKSLQVNVGKKQVNRRWLGLRTIRRARARCGRPPFGAACVGRRVPLGLLKKRSHDRPAPRECLCVYGVRAWRRRL